MSEPSILPPGIWEELFPQALTVIDEIRKHGGVSNPMFTFGGGTVLMLRYDHRLSKDIAIFVPDPQSLNYVTPRLSDVADTICHSQYVETAGYVKLQLPRGEIDFVASPNLLPQPHAFENWTIFGQQIRVETAAEIIAKKMFHRGDKATARDLFDLAMVVEREPAALEHAKPFFYRHANAFVANVKTAGAGFVGQFNNIETRTYQPTFEHAAGIALAYFEELKNALNRSAFDARIYAEGEGQKVVEVNNNNGRYVGQLLKATSHHVLQQVGSGNVMIHEKHRLPIGTQNMPAGTSLDLHYSHGTASARSSKKIALV